MWSISRARFNGFPLGPRNPSDWSFFLHIAFTFGVFSKAIGVYFRTCHLQPFRAFHIASSCRVGRMILIPGVSLFSTGTRCYSTLSKYHLYHLIPCSMFHVLSNLITVERHLLRGFQTTCDPTFKVEGDDPQKIEPLGHVRILAIYSSGNPRASYIATAVTYKLISPVIISLA